MPEDLRGAVLRSWHHLSVEARQLVLAVAIGGEPAEGAALQRAVTIAGTAPTDTPRLLLEAVDAGALDASPHGGYWFHHPLQVEALDSFLAGEERRRLHAAFAGLCEDDLSAHDAPTSGSLAATSAIAEHHAAPSTTSRRIAGPCGRPTSPTGSATTAPASCSCVGSSTSAPASTTSRNRGTAS